MQYGDVVARLVSLAGGGDGSDGALSHGHERNRMRKMSAGTKSDTDPESE